MHHNPNQIQVPPQNAMNLPSHFNQNNQLLPAVVELNEWNGIKIQQSTGTYAESFAGTEVSWLPNMKSLINGDIKPDQEQPDRAKMEENVMKAKEEYMQEMMRSAEERVISIRSRNDRYGVIE